MSLSVCALSIHVWEQYGPWLPPKAPSLFSLLSHWLNWLMKCSVIQPGEKILTTAMKPNHKGLRWSRERLNERERKMKLKVIILVDLRTPLLFVQQRYHCVFVCLWPSACITRGVSVNQSTPILYTSSPDGCPRLLVDTVYSCFPSADSSHPEEAAQPCLLQTWAAFKGSKINHHRRNRAITWCPWGLSKRQVIVCFQRELSLSSENYVVNHWPARSLTELYHPAELIDRLCVVAGMWSLLLVGMKGMHAAGKIHTPLNK